MTLYIILYLYIYMYMNIIIIVPSVTVLGKKSTPRSITTFKAKKTRHGTFFGAGEFGGKLF